MKSIKLPASLIPSQTPDLGSLRQLTIIGGNGAGKSRFMDEMIALNEERSYSLNVLSAFFPQLEMQTNPHSIDARYRDAVKLHSYLRSDAVSEFDKLLYLLFNDELTSLIEMKRERTKGKNKKIAPTRLDKVIRHWEALFPGNRILLENGRFMFGTTAGNDLITSGSLSQGEKAVLYYLGAVSYAPSNAVIFIDSPSLFINPWLLSRLWNTIESLRQDCVFVYNSVDEDFVSTRTSNVSILVRRYDSGQKAWEYLMMPPGKVSEELRAEFSGSRRRVLFIEGDAEHSIDKRLYSLVFPEMDVRPLGSCNKVIETTRTLGEQSQMHNLLPMGIVDRDRRSDEEVAYLRKKQIMVPEVAEIENLFMLPGVISVMAAIRGKEGDKIMKKVKRDVIRMFKSHAEEQALQHVRHRVKREVECRIDARFSCITALETHLRGLAGKLQPRMHYNRLREQFAAMVRDNDYDGILRVFNHKPMLPESGIHRMLGFRTKEEYITGVLETLKGHTKAANNLREVIRHNLKAPERPESQRLISQNE